MDDTVARSGPMQMGLDEALLETQSEPLLRYYTWQTPAISFGYFSAFAAVEDRARERDLVRRWTGGGIVEHGRDLTYSLIVPRSHPVNGKRAGEIYSAVH